MSEPVGLQWKDFCPFGEWSTIQYHVYDRSSQLRFFVAAQTAETADRTIARVMCLLGIPICPILNTGLAVVNLAYRVGKLVTLSHFWWPSDRNQTMRQRAHHALTDVARVLATPVCLLGLVASPLYGLFNPLDGVKLYSSFARALYGEGRLYKCAVPPRGLQPRRLSGQT